MRLSWPLIAVGTGAVAALAALSVRRRFAVVTVSGESMLPAFVSGDRVLVRRVRLAELRRGQVVVVRWPNGDDSRKEGVPVHAVSAAWLIKRVAALPGDPAPSGHLPVSLSTGPLWVPDGKLVVLGDNTEASHDSRQLGYFSGDELLGIVVRRMNLR